jgi:hypothetical protein
MLNHFECASMTNGPRMDKWFYWDKYFIGHAMCPPLLSFNDVFSYEVKIRQVFVVIIPME